jgi:hypothetical protein
MNTNPANAMKTFKALMALTACLTSAALAETVNFDHVEAGKLPAGWTAAQTGKGAARWSVETDASAPSKPRVLKQNGEADYPVAFKDDANFKDGFVEVKFKSVAGREDQAGGVVWRAKDADNYYIARANALEGNVRIYHFLKGKRTQFKGVNAPVAANQWHTLRVNFSGNLFTVFFNGKELFRAEDDTHAAAGKVGVWTKADSVTLFDDFSYDAK